MKIALPRKFYGLLGKLLLSYLAITTISAVISGQIMGLYEYYILQRAFNSENVSAETSEKARQVATFFGDSAPNVEAINLWLKLQKEETQKQRRALAPDIYTLFETDVAEDFSVVFDADGITLTSTDVLSNKIKFQSDERLQTIELILIKSVLEGERDATKLVRRDGDLRIVAVAPIFDGANNLRGVLLLRKNLPFAGREAILYVVWNWMKNFSFLFMIFVYTGTLFSFFVGRHLIKRLNRIESAANAWSVGDFSARAVDNSNDEIGLLTQRLNSMAMQLSNFFELRQNLAAVEERNRLARELHDSVKQQVFALSMQIGAAKRVLSAGESNNKTIGLNSRLHEAEKLANQVQHELQVLINELRPSSTIGEPLNLRLKTLAADWSRQSLVATETRLEKTPTLALTHENAIFRITQEALANVTRHAEATKVLLELVMITSSELQISISDNGKGFENTDQQKGLGLKTMRERAENLPHGWFEINSQLQSGTRVTVGCRTEKN